MFGMIKSLWQYRRFTLSSIRNDLFSRFARSKIGAMWVIINPLAQVAIYALILSNIMAMKLPGIEEHYSYAIYLLAGLLAFNLFNEVVSRCLNLFIENADLIKKVNFPRITLPSIVVGSCVINNLFLLFATFVIFALLGHQFNLAMLWLIPLTIIVMLLALGIGLTLGVVNVFVRDVGQAVPIILQLLFWFTPIVYPVTIIPENLRQWLNLNPLYPLTEAYHQVLVYNAQPKIDDLIFVTLLSIVLSMLCLFIFRRASADMADVL